MSDRMLGVRLLLNCLSDFLIEAAYNPVEVEMVIRFAQRLKYEANKQNYERLSEWFDFLSDID